MQNKESSEMTFYDRRAMKDRGSKKEKVSLTRKEKEILAMIALGAKNDEIAAELFISSNTVKTHVYNIYKKINVQNKIELIKFFNQSKLNI